MFKKGRGEGGVCVRAGVFGGFNGKVCAILSHTVELNGLGAIFG